MAQTATLTASASAPTATTSPAATKPQGSWGGHGPQGPVDRQGNPVSEKQAWRALWSLLVGFFMILVDSTIVTTAIPAIQTAMNTSVNGVVWVTSAYLLTYAVPLLVTGRLGDKFGPRNVFIVGLVIFTASSAWCGFAGSIGMLIAARAVQGLGAALMTPQSMAVITRLFPFNRRGAAMGLWGSTAGVATLVGPILGGILVDSLDWRWIFFVNIPFGIIGIIAVLRQVPDLPRVTHGFDWIGVVLSALGMFLIVFGLQEGNTYHWGTIRGILSVPLLLILGALVMVGFVVWEAKGAKEPLVPLRLFRTWNFSMGNILTFCVGVFITSMSFPLMLFLQNTRYLSPTKAALCMIVNAVLSGVLSPVVGRNLQKWNARIVITVALALFSATFFTYSWMIRHDKPIWEFVLLGIPMGIASAMTWGPISLITTRDLSPKDAGAGSSIFNTTRQMGSVLGSAMISLVMTRRINHWMASFVASLPPVARAHVSMGGRQEGHAAAAVVPYLQHAFSDSMFLPACAALVGALAALFVRVVPHDAPHGHGHGAPAKAPEAAPATSDAAKVSERTPELVGAGVGTPLAPADPGESYRPRRALPETE